MLKQKYSKKKKLFCLSTNLFVIVLLLFGFSNGTWATSLLDQVIEEAKQEGEVVFYESQPEEAWVKIMEAFQKRYPFIKKWRHERLMAADNVTRVISESQAKASTADLVGNTPPEMASIAQRGIFREVDWRALGLSQKTIFDRYHAIQSSYITIIAYHTQLVSAKDVPKKWEELLEPKWKGKVAASFRADPWATLAAVWGLSKTEECVKKFLANEFVQIRTTTAVTSWVVLGQSPVGVGSFNLFEKAKETGAPVDWVFAQPVPINLILNAIPKGAKHPNAGMLLIHWLTLPEGAKIYEQYTGRGNPYVPGTKYESLVGKLNLATWPAERLNEFLKVTDTLEAILKGEKK